MDLTRRDFIKLIGGGATGAVIFSACGVPDEELYFQSPNKSRLIKNFFKKIIKFCCFKKIK